MSNIKKDEFIKSAKDFVLNEIRPYVVEFENNEGIPRELILKMGKCGYLAATFPEKYGGLGVDAIQYGLLTEIIGKACPSTRALLTVQTSLVGETVLRWGTEQQKSKLLPLIAKGETVVAFALSEPKVGTDAGSVETSYVKYKDGFLINGKKKWITFGGIADVFLLIAVNSQGLSSAFLVDRETKGINVKKINGLLASKATYIAEIEFHDVYITEDKILGVEGGGNKYIVNTALHYGRYSIAWGGLAIAQEALESMVSYSRNRKQFGSKICDFQLIRAMIGDAVTKIHAGRALCLQAGELISNNENEAIIQTCIAKYFISVIANEIASDAVQIHGGNGCINVFPVERLFREAKLLEIIEGTNQIHQKIISDYGLRKYYKFNYYVE